MDVVQIVSQLGKALWNLKGMYDQHVENGNEIKELQSFIKDYDEQIPILKERFQEGGGNVMGIAAFKNLEKDVMEATNKLERWSRNKSFFRVFNSAQRMQELGKLHSKVMASVQKSLGIANLSTLLDLQATQATILESTTELKSLLITSIGSMQGTLPTEVREKVVEASTSSFADPKFWEDILAVVDNHNVGISLLEENNMYEDPITTKLMIDPVVASDGNTYCRWTIIDNNWTTNPFNVDEDLTIVIDSLTFRRGLFEKFPEQVQIFRQRRNEYRSHAFSLKDKGLWGDAILALHYVLQWDKHDVECVEALQQVKIALEEAKEKYLEPSVKLSNEQGKGGSINTSMHEMVGEPSIQLHEAYKLFLKLSSSTLEHRQQVTYGICQWSERDVKFQKYIIKNGGISLLAALLPSSDQITQEHIVSILLDVSRSSYKRRTMLGMVKPDYPDALEPIVDVLKEGSMKAREQAARIFLNLSVSSNRKSIIGNSRAMLALVTSLGDGSLQFQQIASETLNNLFPDSLESIVEVLKKGSTEDREQAARILLNFSTNRYRKNIMGYSSALRDLVTLYGDGTPQFQQFALDTLNNLFPDSLESIVEVLNAGSTGDREQAAKILLNFSTNINRKSVMGNSGVVRALVTLYGDGTPQFQQFALDTLNNLFPDSLESIVEVLNAGSTGDREQAARILLNFSTNIDRKSVMGNSGVVRALVPWLHHGTSRVQQFALDTLNNLFPDSLESIVEVLNEGSTGDYEQAAKILLNFSTNIDRKSVMGNSRVVRALVPWLRHGTSQVQQFALDTLNNLFPDSLESIVEVLNAGSTGDREQAAKILLNFSTNIDRKSVMGNSGVVRALVHASMTLYPSSIYPAQIAQIAQLREFALDTLNNLFPDALESIVEVLKEGPTEDRKQAAKILFNFSTNINKRSIIGKSGAMCALVTMLDDNTLQVQQIVASTLNNLCQDVENETQAIKAGLVPILIKLIANKPMTMLEEALPLVDNLLNFWNRSMACHAIRIEAPATTWLGIMASESSLNQERAASILYTLCYGDEKYSQQARECQALEQITEFTLPSRTKHNLFELLNSNVANKNYPTLPIIPFPKKDWWSPVMEPLLSP